MQSHRENKEISADDGKKVEVCKNKGELGVQPNDVRCQTACKFHDQLDGYQIPLLFCLRLTVKILSSGKF